jgi:hypothetical protein
MKHKKGVTEDDLRATEARIHGSFMGLKQAMMDIPGEATKPVTDTVRKHPFLAVAASAGAGFLLYQLITSLRPRTKVIIKETGVHQEIKAQPRRSLLSRIMSESLTLAMPYITNFVQQEVSSMLAGKRRGEPVESEAGTVNGPNGR